MESKYDCECYVFHATGHGGKGMERLVRQGMLDAVLDLVSQSLWFEAAVSGRAQPIEASIGLTDDESCLRNESRSHPFARRAPVLF